MVMCTRLTFPVVFVEGFRVVRTDVPEITLLLNSADNIESPIQMIIKRCQMAFPTMVPIT